MNESNALRVIWFYVYLCTLAQKQLAVVLVKKQRREGEKRVIQEASNFVPGGGEPNIWSHGSCHLNIVF